MSVVAGLLTATVPIVQKIIVDDVIVDGTRELIPWLGVLLAVGLGLFAATGLRRFLGPRFSLGVQDGLRSAIYRHLLTLDERVRANYQSGDIFSRTTADITLLQGILGRVHLVIGHLVFLAAALTSMVLLSVPLALVIGACVPVFLFVAWRMRSRLFPAAWNDQRAIADTTTVVAETVAGVRVIKAFGTADREAARYETEARNLFRSRLRTTRVSAFYGATLEALPALAQVLVVGIGGWLVIEESITIGTFIAFTSFVGQMLRPVRSISVFLTNREQARAGAERIISFLEEDPTVETDDAALKPATTRGSIEFRDVTFGYDHLHPVLEHCSLRIESGERVAIVGPSGSGKSTLAKLLVRMYDVDSGSITLDGSNITSLDLDTLRREIAGVIDEPFLFSASVGENIAFARPAATHADVRYAAEIAGIADLVDQLPDGLDTVLGERGLTLSGGQRQRLALARAVVADPSVLVLDDATSAIDARTESKVFDGLERLSRDRTTIVIAHRRSTLRLVDRIVVMENGRVTASGTTESLLSESEAFRSIWGTSDSDEFIQGPQPARPVGTPSLPAAPDPSHRKRTLAPSAVATPSLIAAVERLPALSGEPDTGLAHTPFVDDFGMRSLIRPFVGPLAIGLALVAASAALALAGPALVGVAMDEGIVPGSLSNLSLSTVWLLVTVVVAWAISRLTTAYTSKTAERMLYVLRVRLFRHLMRLALGFFDRAVTGRIIARMTADIEALATLFQQGLVGTAVSMVTAFGVIIVLLVLDWRLALAVFTTFIPLAIMTAVFRTKARKAHIATRAALSRLYSELGQGIEGIGTTQMHAQEQAMADRLAQRSHDYRDARMRNSKLAAAYFPAVQFLASLASLIVLGVGAILIEDGEISAGLIVAFLLYIGYLFRPMQELSEQLDQWTAARVSLRKIHDLFNEKPEPQFASGLSQDVELRRVELNDVVFAYPGFDTKALDGVSLHIDHGDTIAIVGESGAGKSSLAKLVMAFYQPTSGTVDIDGVDLATLDPARHRNRVGYVPQEPMLFAMSVRDNIAYGRPNATDKEVEDVARLVGVHDTILDLPGGYATHAGKQGRSLSMGERQLICLARALLVEPDLLILDEATANLDLSAERRVQKAMERAAVRRTTLVIAHRLQTVVDADRVVVLDRGRIVEDGQHNDLVAAGGAYAILWRAFADSESQPA